MKISPRTLIAFVLSGTLGFLVAYLLISKTEDSPTTISDSNYPDSEAIESLKKQNRLLESTIIRLKAENRELQARCDELIDVEDNSEEQGVSTQRLKDQWVQEVMNQSDSRRAQQLQSEMTKLQQRYHLTPDQMLQLEPLLNQREQLSKTIMMRHMGLISEEEFKAKLAMQKDFNFDQELTNLLSDEQKQRYLEHQDTQQNIGLNIAAYSFAEQYGITDTERFTPEQQSSIQGLYKQALESSPNLDIPPSIQELDIDIMEKRMLSIGYQELDDDTFRKMYQAIVDHHLNQ